MEQKSRLKAIKALEKRGISLGGAGQAAKAVGGGFLKSLPLVGNVLSGGSALYNLGKGNFGSAALDAAGMIPGVGNYINLGRVAYGLGQSSGAAQAQPPQGLPNYGKMAGLCPNVERTKRGLAFEAGVERFCKEAGFDDEDKNAVYQLILKVAEIGDDITPTPDQTWINDYDKGTSVTPSGDLNSGGLFNDSASTHLNQDPRLSTWERTTDLAKRFGNTVTPTGLHWYDAVPGVLSGRAAYNLASGWLQGTAEKTMKADDAVRRRQSEEAMHAKNPEAYKQMMYNRATAGTSKSDQYIDRQQSDVFATAKRKEKLFGMDPATAIFESTKGLPGAEARAWQGRYLKEGGGASSGNPGAQPNQSMPGVAMAQPNVANLGRTAPPGPSGGYMTGSPPVTPGMSSGAANVGSGLNAQAVNPSRGKGTAASTMGDTPGASPMGPPTPNQGPPAMKPSFKGNATSSMGDTPGANPMTPPPKSSGSMPPPKTPKV